MATYPKDDTAKTGSNLRGNPLLDHRIQLVAAQQRPLQRLARDFNRDAKRLFSKADLRVAAAIAAQAKKEWSEASLALRGDTDRIDALRASARKKLDRSLAREFRNYRKLKALQREHEREHRKLGKVVAAGVNSIDVHLASGGVVADDPIETQEFTVPFAIFDTHAIDEAHFIINDDSFVSPASGVMVNNVTFHQDEDTPVIIGLYGLIRAEPASSMVSLGIPFTMPRPGQLQVGASIQNFSDWIDSSLHDNLGFSYGNLDVRLDLFIDIVRPGSVIHIPRTLVSYGLTSNGDNVSHAGSNLDNSVPYLLNAITEETFPQGEVMYIMVGSEVHIDSELDDMITHVSAVIGWQLKKITVGILD